MARPAGSWTHTAGPVLVRIRGDRAFYTDPTPSGLRTVFLIPT